MKRSRMFHVLPGCAADRGGVSTAGPVWPLAMVRNAKVATFGASKAPGGVQAGLGRLAPLRGVPCGTRLWVVPPNSLRLLRRAALKQYAASQFTKRAGTRADPKPELLGGAYSPGLHPTRRLAGHGVCFPSVPALRRRLRTLEFGNGPQAEARSTHSSARRARWSC
jgi:hypothetical protein